MPHARAHCHPAHAYTTLSHTHLGLPFLRRPRNGWRISSAAVPMRATACLLVLLQFLWHLNELRRLSCCMLPAPRAFVGVIPEHLLQLCKRQLSEAITLAVLLQLLLPIDLDLLKGRMYARA